MLSKLSPRKSNWIPALSMGLLLALGVFFSNLNIDQYRASWQSQSNFLGELLRRFPDVPQNAYLIADINSKDLYSDLRYYDIEFPINLLYARSTAKSDFYQHRIILAKDFEPFAYFSAAAQKAGKIRFNLALNNGIQSIDINRFIFVYFRDGKLLVNKEITVAFPDISYRSWLDRPLPDQDHMTSLFPLRAKINFASQ